MAFPEYVIVPQARDSENPGLTGSVWRGPVGEGTQSVGKCFYVKNAVLPMHSRRKADSENTRLLCVSRRGEADSLWS